MAAHAKPSVTFTALIWFGMVLAAVGVVVALLGVGDAVDFNVKLGDAEVTTSSLGLAILAVGALLAGFVATRLPKNVAVFAITQPTFLERVAQRAGWFLVLAIVAIALLVASLVYR